MLPESLLQTLHIDLRHRKPQDAVIVVAEHGRDVFPQTDLKLRPRFRVGAIVFGDHRDTPTGISTRPSWQESFDGCQELIGRIKAAGGQAEMLTPPDRGIRGNSHMIMQDKNNLQIADLILQWLDEHVSRRSSRAK